MTATFPPPWGRSQDKIRAEALDRAAVVYVRQSTRQQVAEHGESTRLQYALVERAVALGWARSRVEVIDDDLGHSAAVAETRPGFAKLVTEVTMGRVGLVLGVEMSRLARTGRDWHQLIELCSLSGALLADPDGVYDPSYYNDRLLLGLKGTMSEAELYLIRQRMQGGKMAKAERGELAIRPPIGYWRRPSGEVVFEPDEQARTLVHLVFDTFARIGTLNGVLRYLVAHDLQLPVRSASGADKGELTWRRPSRETLQNMLHNPIYAGYYAYGRRQSDVRRRKPGRPSTGRVVTAMDSWHVLLPDRMPAYISAGQYAANLRRLEANRNTAAAPGAPRGGSALLAGLLHCGLCGGHKMTSHYHRHGPHPLTHRYACAFYPVNYGTGQPCQTITGPALDAHVVDQVLAAVRPAAVEVSLKAAEQAEAERAVLETLWRQRVERARLAAERAARQYRLAEPENRLVIRQLEKDWETALAEQARLEADYQRFTETRPAALSAAERDAVHALAADLPRLWADPQVTTTERKELLRTLIERITVAVVGRSELVDVTITWAGGFETHSRAVRPVLRYDQLSYFPHLLQRLTDLAGQGMNVGQITARLNTEGLRPPKRTTRFTTEQVGNLLIRHDIRVPGHRRTPAPDLPTHQWTVKTLAAELDLPINTVYSWIYRGWITSERRPGLRFRIIRADAAEIQRLRALRDLPRGHHTKTRWQAPVPPQPHNNTERQEP
ncbi:recombinase family protein [Streptomyces dysideae]|uniref:Transposase n=1 Tax=Streptomyces dysideae TaxID=909626 RepID=A0A101V421_9ACTN|nr:recombinase family protein [Streptomyces dysideae]KUO22110.1 transposase [Streptomyces dysideae]